MKKSVFGILIFSMVFGFIVYAIADYGTEQKVRFIQDETVLATRIVQLRADILAHTQKWNSRGYVAGGANPIIVADYAGTAYEGLTVAEITAGQTTLAAFETWINAGHDDNLEKLAQ